MSIESNPTEHIDQIAFLLFDDRQQAERDGDGNCPEAFEPGANPHAQALYLLGMRDLINCMRSWHEQAIEPEVISAMLDSIYHASSVAATAH